MSLHRRELNRLSGWNYKSDGWYFVTFCVENMNRVLGKVDNGLMILNNYGEIVRTHIDDLPNHYGNCRIDDYIVMPNHVHIIIRLVGNGLETVPVLFNEKDRSLSEIMRGLKTFSSRRINELERIDFQLHKSFHDRIIRSDKEYWAYKKYIEENPKKFK